MYEVSFGVPRGIFRSKSEALIFYLLLGLVKVVYFWQSYVVSITILNQLFFVALLPKIHHARAVNVSLWSVKSQGIVREFVLS